jgi:FolB domain-containing protein
VKSIPAVLRIHQLRADVHLGEHAHERAQPQAIDIYVDIYFEALPPACFDDAGAFLCYDKLSVLLRQCATSKPYRLIEYLCMQLVEVTRAEIVRALGEEESKRVFVRLRLAKRDAPVEGLLAGTSFEFCDLPRGVLS